MNRLKNILLLAFQLVVDVDFGGTRELRFFFAC